MASDTPSLGTRVAILLVSSGITAGLAEGLVRLADDNAMPMIRLFDQNPNGTIELQKSGEARIGTPIGGVWVLETNADGHRKAPQEPNADAWIVVGDSQVMGNGVDGAEPFPARVILDGGPAHNAGVPGYGVEDAVAKAERHLTATSANGVVVIVNQMNDWDEAGRAVIERYQVRGGWLLDTEDAAGRRGSFLASPLSSSHLCFLAGHLMLRDWEETPEPAPAWLTKPESQISITATIARSIHALAARHPEVPVVPVYLPADAYAAQGRATKSPLTPHLQGQEPWKDTRLRDQVMTALSGLDPLDLTPILTGRADAFLEADYHLSEIGHGLVAAAISQHVATRDERLHVPEEPATETPDE